VRLSLEKLRELPLSNEARLALLQELAADAEDDPLKLQLWSELAQLAHRCCEEAYGKAAWTEALEHHDTVVSAVVQLVTAQPERAPDFWGRYGELLAFLTAQIHAVVVRHSEQPLPQAERAQLSWDLAQRLERATGWPCSPPEWLPVLEQQLVQDGAFDWKELGEGAPGESGEAARQKALHLLFRLNTLLTPSPDWVVLMAQGLLQEQVESVLGQAEPNERALLELITTLEGWPVAEETREAMATALLRARLALGLLVPELVAERAPEGGTIRAEQERASAGQVASVENAAVAELVFLEDGASPSPCQLDAGCLVAVDFAAIDAALDDFVWHLPRGCQATQAASALPQALEARWRQGLRLDAAAFERLAYLAAAWQRRLAERLLPLPAIDWQHSMLVELGASELAVLRPMLAEPQAMAEALALLRREHHNAAFWQQREEVPWMEAVPPVEALRRMYREEGLYAGGHEPMQSLQTWGREATLTLLEAELWTDDAGCLGAWLGLAQELVLAGKGPLPLLGAPPSAEALLAQFGGLEVLYVGEEAEAVKEAHRTGRCFRGAPFGLRVLSTPASRWPAMPTGGFEQSVAVLMETLDGLYRQRPFAVLLADCGAYRLPLLRAAHHRYGVAALSSGRPMARWLG
jgi:hypothetical protein